MTLRGRYVTGAILLFLFGLFFLMWISVLLNISGRDGLNFTGDDPAVGVVDITGAIYHARPVVRQIKRLRDDHDIRGLLVRSPGKAAAAVFIPAIGSPFRWQNNTTARIPAWKTRWNQFQQVLLPACGAFR